MGHHQGMASRRLRPGRPLAALIAALTVAIFVTGVVKHVIDAGAPSLLDSLGLVGIVTFLLFPVMGLLLVRRQPSNAVGWLLLGIGLAVFIIFNSGDFASVHYRGPLPISQV